MTLIDNRLKQLFTNPPIDQLNKTFDAFSINTKVEQAAFVAQVAHESNNFRSKVENLNYSAAGLAATWPSRFRDSVTRQPNGVANKIARQPKLIANAVYNGRLGNGIGGDDGWNYRGRGYIQLTGKANYAMFGAELVKRHVIEDPDLFVNNPDLVATDPYAMLSAGVYWARNNLSRYVNDFTTLTRKINGGTIGLQQRKALFDKLVATS